MTSLFHPEGTLRPLRGRQIPLIDAIRDAVREKHKRIIVQAPTGFGKTIVAAHLMNQSAAKGRRPIFICPAIALVEQTLLSFEAQGIRDIGIIQAQHHRTDWKAQIQIASRDTLVRRKLPEVDFAIVDEAHDRRQAMTDILNGDAWKDKVVVGLSATPWAKGLGLDWTKLIIAATMAEMIEDGPPTGLSPFRVYSVPPDYEPDMSGVKTVAGEFAEGATSTVMSDKRLVGNAVEHWLKTRQSGEHPGDHTFLYGVDRNHAKTLMEAFQAEGVSCGYIDGESGPEERLRTFQRYRSGEDKVLANVGVLLTGVDEDVRCMVDCAPTKSEIRHVQKLGRGARLADGKDYLLLLDHAGNCVRLGLPWDIHHDTLDCRKPGEKGEAYADDAPVPKPRKCRECFAIIPPRVKACPKCGFVPPVFSDVQTVAGELALFDGKAQKVKKEQRSLEQRWFSSFVYMAERRGFKPGWADMKFKAKFGEFPKGLERRATTPIKAAKEWDAQQTREWRAAKKAEAQNDTIATAG